jgi:hypothetical protein
MSKKTVLFRKYKRGQKAQYMYIDRDKNHLYIYSHHLPKELKQIPLRITKFQRLKGTENKFLVTGVEPVYSKIHVTTMENGMSLRVTGFHEPIQYYWTRQEMKVGKKKEKIKSILMFLAKKEMSLGYQNKTRKLALLKQ